ncbi:hypothetical protein ACLOAU_11360 [Niabella sp. CJ426]|uniref:hypothetical protein n=1 Tax=Niabella sp. CJ426 TaxID=3393740 RepID=UPI003CFF9FF9
MRKAALKATLIEIVDFNEIFNQLTKDQVEEYNKELGQYKLDYRTYLEQRYAWERFVSLSFAIELMISNIGTAPASDIDIWMHFPNGFKLINENDFPEKPNPPKTPYKPKSKFDFDNSALSSFSQRSFLSLGRPQSAPYINPNKPDIRETNSCEVKIPLKSLKHYHSFTIDPLIVVFEALESISNFQIDYRIIVGNLPHPLDGKLNVKVSQHLKKE